MDLYMNSYISPSDPGYDELRAIWNAMHDKRPALIARCGSARDVADAIRHAREHDLTIAVRSGGHSLPGHSAVEGGMVIDLRPLSRVSVDPVARRAKVGGGALLGDVDRATQAHGLVVPAGVVSHTGVGGLTLGGGVGRLMRRYGLTIDSLLAAEVVTASGERVRASAEEHPDLFWALRGGGGNFGVVTEFEFALHDISELGILATFHPLEDAPAVLEQGRRAMAEGPDELLWTSFLRRAPDVPWVPQTLVGRRGIMSLVEWSGGMEHGLERLAAIRDELSPAAGDLSVVPFLTMQTITDEVFAHGLRTYIKAGFASELSDGLIDALIERGAAIGSPITQIEVLAMGGAIGRMAPDATAFPYRDAGWLINIPASWRDAADDEREVAWARGTYAAVQPHLTGGAYANFMGVDDEDADAYRGTLARLAAVKAVYDP